MDNQFEATEIQGAKRKVDSECFYENIFNLSWIRKGDSDSMVNSEWTVKTLSFCNKDSWLKIRKKSVLMKNSQFGIDCWFKVNSGKTKWYSVLSAKNSGFIVNFANQSWTNSQIAKEKWM